MYIDQIFRQSHLLTLKGHGKYFGKFGHICQVKMGRSRGGSFVLVTCTVSSLAWPDRSLYFCRVLLKIWRL